RYATQLLSVLPKMVKDRPLTFRGEQLIRGTAIRHLLIPGRADELVNVLRALLPFADDALVNVMTHYYIPSEHRVQDVALPTLEPSLRRRFRLYVNGRRMADG